MDKLEGTRAFIQDVDRARNGKPIREDEQKTATASTHALKIQPAMKQPSPQKATAPDSSASRSAKKKLSPAADVNIDKRNHAAGNVEKRNHAAGNVEKRNHEVDSVEKRNNVKAPARQPATSQSKTKEIYIRKKDAAPPLQGKAKYDCGCFGTLHRSLTNCLHCGRILCEREGYGFCSYCGYLVEEAEPHSSGSDLYVVIVAWLI